MAPAPKLLAAISALVAGVIWGAWAYYVNIDSERVFISATAQFFSSAIVTVLMSIIVLRTQAQFKAPFNRVLMPAVVSSIFAILILVTFHSIAKTPKLLVTILAPAIVGFVYSLFYSYQVNR